MTPSRQSPFTILLATNNPHKAEEIEAILAGIDSVRLVTMRDLPERPPEPVEDGATLEANAYIKARELHELTGFPTIADDTGLEVDALDGAPGAYSARYAGNDATYEDNWRRLLHELDSVPDPSRTARFRCVVCYVDHQRTLLAEGRVEGTILRAPRGKGGFGYDPVFLPDGRSRTFAEMSPDEKHAVSHRGRALARLKEILAPLLDERADDCG